MSNGVKANDKSKANSWVREAYFAELLVGDERALRVLDRFVEVDGGQMRFCLAMEYTAEAFNLFHVPAEIAWGRVRRWQKRDDVYQIGLIAAMLLRGDISSPMHSKDVRALPCSDHLKEVIHRFLWSTAHSGGEKAAAVRRGR